MKITIFTSNSLRHNYFINQLSKVAKVYTVVETKTLLPGKLKCFFKQSILQEKYFSNVRKAEENFFFKDRSVNKVEKTLVMQQGDINHLKKSDLKPFLNSNLYLVFGSSYIKGWLVNFLTRKRAINIHMGLSPFYRGSSCNFWAIYNSSPEHVGATIHFLSKGLDNGKIIYQCLPNLNFKDAYNFTMSSVLSVTRCLVDLIKKNKLLKIKSIESNKLLEISYTKKADFTDKIIKKFFTKKLFNLKIIKKDIISKQKAVLERPFYLN